MWIDATAAWFLEVSVEQVSGLNDWLKWEAEPFLQNQLPVWIWETDTLSASKIGLKRLWKSKA